jgi:hypothetical protein
MAKLQRFNGMCCLATRKIFGEDSTRLYIWANPLW